MKFCWRKYACAAFNGYTMIEVLAVCLIIGVLATIPIASMRQAKVKANEVQAISALNMMAVAYESYNNESNPHRYPQYLANGVLYKDLIDFPTAQAIWDDLCAEKFIPRKYSGRPLNLEDMLAKGFTLTIFPFSVTPSFSASPRYNYVIGMVPYPGSPQPRAIAIFQGNSFNDSHISARARKIPGTGDYSGAKFYTWQDF